MKHQDNATRTNKPLFRRYCFEKLIWPPLDGVFDVSANRALKMYVHMITNGAMAWMRSIIRTFIKANISSGFFPFFEGGDGERMQAAFLAVSSIGVIMPEAM